MLTVGAAILKSQDYLARKGVDSPRLDAELLLGHVLGVERLRLYLDWDKPLMELEVAAYRDLIKTRGVDRTPVARLLGHKEFYGRDFEVSPATFVPRPETEGLVDRALDLLANDPLFQTHRPVVFEVGTGTGCITISLAAGNGGPHYIASEASPDALATARRNAERHHLTSRIDFRSGRNLAGYGGAIHLLVSNPPYIPTEQIATLDPEVAKHDPMLALDGGPDGLDATRLLLREALPLLADGAPVLLELGEDHEEGILEVFRTLGGFRDARMERDHAGRPRYAFARRAIGPITLRDSAPPATSAQESASGSTTGAPAASPPAGDCANPG
jgi:release factor glutamine methyltransferase